MISRVHLTALAIAFLFVFVIGAESFAARSGVSMREKEVFPLTPETFTRQVILDGEAGSVLSWEVSEDVYRNLRLQAMNDLCVFDAEGNVVPFQLRAPEFTSTRTSVRVPLNHHVWTPTQARQSSSKGGMDIEIDRNTGTVSIRNTNDSGQTATSDGKQQENANILNNAREEDQFFMIDLEPLHALVNAPDNYAETQQYSSQDLRNIELTINFAPTGSFMYTVTMQTSDDLVHWENIGTTQALARLGSNEKKESGKELPAPSSAARQQNANTEQQKTNTMQEGTTTGQQSTSAKPQPVPIGQQHSNAGQGSRQNTNWMIQNETLTLPKESKRYLLVQFTGANVPVLSFQASAYFSRAQEVTRFSRFHGVLSEDKTTVDYSLGGYFPLVRMHFELPEPDILKVKLYSVRPNYQHLQAESVLYRLEKNGARMENAPLSITSRYSQWHLKAVGGVHFLKAPDLVIEWKPLELRFLARGKAPWTVAYGREQSVPSTAVSMLDEVTPLKATVIQSSAAPTTAPQATAPASDETNSFVLWGILGFAVVFLTGVALWLLRSMNKEKSR